MHTNHTQNMLLTDLDPHILNIVAQNALSPNDFLNMRRTCRTLRSSLSRSLYARHWLQKHGWDILTPVNVSVLIRWMRSIYAFFMEDPWRNMPLQYGTVLVKTKKHTYSIVFMGARVSVHSDNNKPYILRGDSFLKHTEMLFSGVHAMAYTRANEEEAVAGISTDFVEYPHYLSIGPLRCQLHGVVSMITTKPNLFVYRFDIEAFCHQLRRLGRSICT